MAKHAQFIPEDSNGLQEKFINCLMHSGKKSVARKIFRDTMIEIGKRKKDPEDVFERAIEKVRPSMEVRPRRVGGAVYQIPVEVKPERQITLAIRWILLAARTAKGKPMHRKLAQVLLEASEEQGAAFKKKEDTHRMAQANKAFAHFARY